MRRLVYHRCERMRSGSEHFQKVPRRDEEPLPRHWPTGLGSGSACTLAQRPYMIFVFAFKVALATTGVCELVERTGSARQVRPCLPRTGIAATRGLN